MRFRVQNAPYCRCGVGQGAFCMWNRFKIEFCVIINRNSCQIRWNTEVSYSCVNKRLLIGWWDVEVCMYRNGCHDYCTSDFVSSPAVNLLTDWSERRKWDSTFDRVEVVDEMGDSKVLNWWVTSKLWARISVPDNLVPRLFHLPGKGLGTRLRSRLGLLQIYHYFYAWSDLFYSIALRLIILIFFPKCPEEQVSAGSGDAREGREPRTVPRDRLAEDCLPWHHHGPENEPTEVQTSYFIKPQFANLSPGDRAICRGSPRV